MALSRSPLPSLRVAPSIVGIGELRVEPDGPFVVRNRAVGFALGTVRGTPVGVGPSEVGTPPKTGIDRTCTGRDLLIAGPFHAYIRVTGDGPVMPDLGAHGMPSPAMNFRRDRGEDVGGEGLNQIGLHRAPW